MSHMTLPMTLLDEERFTLRERQKLGIDRSYNTLRRWVKDGLRSRITRQVVKLESLREGDAVTTSREAVKRFLAALNGFTWPPEKK